MNDMSSYVKIKQEVKEEPRDILIPATAVCLNGTPYKTYQPDYHSLIHTYIAFRWSWCYYRNDDKA